jgi:hypothetical protein
LYALVASVRPNETKPVIHFEGLRARTQLKERPMWILPLPNLTEEAGPHWLVRSNNVAKNRLQYTNVLPLWLGCNVSHVSQHLISRTRYAKINCSRGE